MALAQQAMTQDQQNPQDQANADKDVAAHQADIDSEATEDNAMADTLSQGMQSEENDKARAHEASESAAARGEAAQQRAHDLAMARIAAKKATRPAARQ